jgi:hypothetical protein
MYKLTKNSIILPVHLQLVDTKINWDGHGNSTNIVKCNYASNFIMFGESVSLF